MEGLLYGGIVVVTPTLLLFLLGQVVAAAASINLTTENNSPVGDLYQMKLQPEYEDFDMARYFRTRELVRFQIRCFFYGGPCDIGNH